MIETSRINGVTISHRQYRVLFSTIILVIALFLIGMNYGSAAEAPYAQFRQEATLPVEDRTPLAPPREGITVVTSHSVSPGDIVALNPNGTLLYHNGTHDGYWDVDPSPQGAYSVVYTASERIPKNDSSCHPVKRQNEHCIRQLIERANLSTGDTTVLYSRIDPRYESSQWHDVDRIDESHYIVADMYADEVFIVDVETGIVVWEWSVQNHLALSTGGPYPEDWVHINDVEVLEDGRVMVSLRNQDQVLFIDPQQGVLDNWTLGADDRHDILYEQHNPDYIPQSNGGPAVLIADSENNRVVEYQRTREGEWNRTWSWQDRQVQWPRDADRLPNGHTLISDSHGGGGRVIEINEQGEIVWSFEVPVPYEAERLNTGDESSNGPSASTAKLRSRSSTDEFTPEQSSMAAVLNAQIRGLFPNKVVNGISNVTPVWVGVFDLAALLLGIITALIWVGLELRWSDIGLRNPIVRN